MKKLFIWVLLAASGLNAQEIYASFFVEAQRDSSLAYNASGIVKSVYADVSDSVKGGDVLVELENSDIKALLEIAKAEVQNAQVVHKYAQRDYERQQKVKNLIDEAKFDMYSLAYERSKAELERAKANLAYREALYDKTFLYAPYDGVIYEKSVEAGDAVNEMALNTLYKIHSKSERKLILEFDQKHWKSVKVGDVFRYKVDGEDKEHRGVIAKVYPQVDAKTRKLKAEVKAKEFKSGLFGDGYIVTGAKE